MNATYKETSLALQNSSFNFTSLEKDSNSKYKELQIYYGPADKAQPARGQVTITIGMEFVPQQPPNNKSYSHGITVEKIVQAYDPVTQQTIPGNVLNRTNSNGSNVNLGDFVVVTIQISTTDELFNVRLVDLLPAAFQPLDTNIYSGLLNSQSNYYGKQAPPEAGMPAPPQGSGVSLHCDWCYYSFGAFNYREYRRDQVVGYARHLYRGSYTFSYMAYVASSGQFYVPSAHVFAIDQPEVMGLSQSFVVRSDTFKVQSVKQLKPELCF